MVAVMAEVDQGHLNNPLGTTRPETPTPSPLPLSTLGEYYIYCGCVV